MTDFPQRQPIDPMPEDRFADALDALVLGMTWDQLDDDALAQSAAAIQAVGAMPTAPATTTDARLDRSAKSRLWSDLMREVGTAPPAQPEPRSPGTAGSTLALNPWVGPESPKPQRSRGSSRVLRFVPAAQPASTFLMVIAVLVLVGATFAGLSPNGGGGATRTALATEDPATLAYASPNALPIAGICDPEAPMYSSDPDMAYEYEPVGPISNRSYDTIADFFATFSACMAGPQFAEVSMISTTRFLNTLRASLAGTPGATDLDRRIADMSEHWNFSLTSQQDVQQFVWEGSGHGDEPMVLNVFPETARMLSDGRTGLLVSITPNGVSPSPDQSWIDSDNPGTYAVFLVALVSGTTEATPVIIDELLGHCGGADCVDLYGPDAESQTPAIADEGAIPVHLQIDDAGVDAEVIAQDMLSGIVLPPEGRWTAGWFVDSALAGQPGNLVLTGFTDDYPEGAAAFRNLPDLPAGTLIEVTAATGDTFAYELESVTPQLSLDDPANQAAITEHYESRSASFGTSTLSIMAFGGQVGGESNDPAYVTLARAVLVDSTPASTPTASSEASPVATQAAEAVDICVGQPGGMSDEQLREMSMNDWLFPSYYSAGVVEPDVAQAIMDTYVAYWQCLVEPIQNNAPEGEVPPELWTYLSDRNRYTRSYDDLSPEQQAEVDEFNCIDRAGRLIDHFPVPINGVAHHVVVPLTNPPAADWENPIAGTPIHKLGDGRYGMMLGAISTEALLDPAQRTDSDWLTFVAFVEVDGHYYVDEEVIVIAGNWHDEGTPGLETEPSACTGA